AKLSGCPLLVSSRRDMGILRKPKHGIAYRLSKPYVDLVLTVSDQVRSFMIERDGLDPRKVVTHYSGVEMERFAKPCNTAELRSSLSLQKASHVVCTVGNIRPVKGLDVYIRAAAQVCRVFPRAVFLIVGYRDDEAHARELERLVRELDLSENVRFVGGREEVHPLLKLSDAFCLLSRSEGFSIALLEAMACGLPCVATRVGGNAEALEEGRSGFLVEAEDAQAAAERILWLLRDSERSGKMGAAGRKVVETRFTVEVMVQNLVHVYDHLLQGEES
ncbi:MAG TPA: glycosyltransferase family 4 protein, partial [Candidatus Acidoferrales bacterium]|nr:glycosyltransferase family 4 protein [Candidatus Acidoferrales bacterium]